MTVLEVIQKATEFLRGKGVDAPRLQAELLLAHALSVPRLQLYLQFDRVLSAPEVEGVREALRRRGRREPLQHIVGSVSFCGYEFSVTPKVLIPRPETELLAERAWQRLQRHEVASASLLDYGTGSGCLVIAIALHCPQMRGVALDISLEALAVAEQNAQRHGVADRIEFVNGDGFGALPAGQRFDLIVANPPYIPTEEIATLSPEVRDYDPRLALDGGPDGLRFYRVLAAEGAAWLRAEGRLLLELGDHQAEAVEHLLTGHNWIVEGVEADYSGRPRVLSAGPRPGDSGS